jgi:hypothetical protein
METSTRQKIGQKSRKRVESGMKRERREKG